jgi:hypothetical protein
MKRSLCSQSSTLLNQFFSSLEDFPRATVIEILLFHYFDHFREPYMIKRYMMNWGQFIIHHPFKNKLGFEDSLLEQIF